ncbi:MAG: protein phosphatase CheZ [Gammaproteobacteria bacterium]
MTAIKEKNSNELLHFAELLVDEVNSGNEPEVNRIIMQMGELQENHLFQEIGKITRKLHTALGGCEVDSRMQSIAQSDIPDAKLRLNHVISMTEDSANRTLSAIETAMPVSDTLSRNSSDLYSKWQKFISRNMSYDEFRSMSQEINDFLGETTQQAKILNQSLTDILMAQDFQDLTGQIIKRVIRLVQEVEDNMVEMIRTPVYTQNQAEATAQQKVHEEQVMSAGQGPAVPNVKDAGAAVNGQDEVDDLLSSLGF